MQEAAVKQVARVPRLIYPIFRDFAIFVIFDGFEGPGVVSIGPERDFAPDAQNISS